MFANYFKIAWRNIFKNKTLSFINIFGLSVGMAFAMLIGMWISYENSFDKFHENGDRLALIRKHTMFNNEKNTQMGIMLPLYDELKKSYPEIKRASRVDWGNHHSLVVGNNKFNKGGYYVDPDFIKMFSFPLVKGDINTALNDPNSIVLTESLATAIFGKENAIGRIIRLDNKYDVMVSAIMKDVPLNSSYQFEFLAPFEFKVINEEFVRKAKNSWGNNFLSNVVEVKEGVSIEALSKKLEPVAMQKDKNLKNQAIILQPFTKVHLYDEYVNWVNTGGKIEYIRLFGIIGIFVLLIACINFMNLSTARSEKRAREVGVRKAVGSGRLQLISQFLIESMVISFVAFLISLIMIQTLLPLLKDLGFENVKFDLTNLNLILSVLAVCLLTGLISGSYPALYLSSFRPVQVLKGLMKQGRGAVSFRKTLVVSQFVISIGLIIGTVIVFQQIQHAKQRPVGYNPNNLLMLFGNADIAKNFDAMKLELLNSGQVEAVSKASSPMTGVWNSWDDFNWEGKDPSADIIFDVVMTEYDYEKTAGLQFVEGRPFSRDFKSDSLAVILNETALRTIAYKNPLGKTIKLGDNTLTIVGVVKDVLMKDPFKPVPSTVIIFDKNAASTVFLRLKKDADIQAALKKIQPIVDKSNPSFPFSYRFVDEEFSWKFQTENQVAKLAGIFAGLAIFISCLGLFGLAMFMAERRAKEISIRKVLGASVANLWVLLSKEFIWLVAIACVIASPLTLYFMSEWLQKYDYRINITWWIFALGGLIAIMIALVTVSVQALKAATANPVRRLRSE